MQGPVEWWLPDLRGDLQSAIEEAMTAIERTVLKGQTDSVELSDNRISSEEDTAENWPNYARWSAYALAVEE